MCLAFPNSEYYDTSDFPIDFLESLIFSLVPQYSVHLRSIWISHVHRCTFITCHALGPRGGSLNLPFIGLKSIAFWSLDTIGPSRQDSFGAQSLQLALTACNVPCLRLTHYITAIGPRLGSKCAGSALSRRYFQP